MTAFIVITATSGGLVLKRGDAMTDEVHQGKVAVITGGGRGFGKAFGTALAARGDRKSVV